MNFSIYKIYDPWLFVALVVILREHAENIQRTCTEHSENIQRKLREHSEYTQRTIREHAENIKRILKEHSENTHSNSGNIQHQQPEATLLTLCRPATTGAELSNAGASRF